MAAAEQTHGIRIIKAALFTGVGIPLSIEHVDLDGPTPGEVLVRVVASGLCHSDYGFMSGALPATSPALFGHEVAGVVEAVGSDVKSLKPGDRVVASYSAFCGYCPQCMTGHTHRCDDRPQRAATQAPRVSWNGEEVWQFSGIGGFAEQILVDQRALIRLPAEMPLDRAALLGCAVLTGVGAVLHKAQVRVGQTVVVIGCGGVGLNAVQGARLAGAGRIIAVDTNPAKLALAQGMGATDLVAGGEHAVEAVRALEPRGVDHVFEVAGLAITARQGLLMLGKGGRLILIGMPAGGTDLELPYMPFILSEVEVLGTVSGSAPAHLLLPRLAEFYLEGRLNLDDLISERIALEDINAGYDRLIAGETARAVITFD